MTLYEAVVDFYYQMTLNELRSIYDGRERLEISYNSLLYLDLISYEKNCTVSYLAETMNITKPAVTAKVNELIRQGLVEKRQSVQDKRVNFLTVSQKARDDFMQYDRRLLAAVNTVQQQYTQSEMDHFCSILGLISRCYTEEQQKENCHEQPPRKGI